jgi:hypothetical protein
MGNWSSASIDDEQAISVLCRATRELQRESTEKDEQLMRAHKT